MKTTALPPSMLDLDAGRIGQGSSLPGRVGTMQPGMAPGSNALGANAPGSNAPGSLSSFNATLQQESVSYQRASLPTIAGEGVMTPQERQAAQSIVGAAQTLLTQVQHGQPAESLFAHSSQLFEAVQTGKFSPLDAATLSSHLDGIKHVLMSSHAYEQGLVIPDAQSAVEGHVTMALDRLDTAMRRGSIS